MTKADLVLTKTYLQKELHALGWRFAGLMSVWGAVILGFIYWQLSDVKNDLRDIRSRLPVLSPTPTTK